MSYLNKCQEIQFSFLISIPDQNINQWTVAILNSPIPTPYPVTPCPPSPSALTPQPHPSHPLRLTTVVDSMWWTSHNGRVSKQLTRLCADPCLLLLLMWCCGCRITVCLCGGWLISTVIRRTWMWGYCIWWLYWIRLLIRGCIVCAGRIKHVGMCNSRWCSDEQVPWRSPGHACIRQVWNDPQRAIIRRAMKITMKKRKNVWYTDAIGPEPLDYKASLLYHSATCHLFAVEL